MDSTIQFTYPYKNILLLAFIFVLLSIAPTLSSVSEQ